MRSGKRQQLQDNGSRMVRTMAATPTLPTSDHHIFLSGWKEIAAYVNRVVRTVQRWEKDLAFPVRRPRGKSRSAVIALRSDIDNWVRSHPLTNGHTPKIADGTVPRPSRLIQHSRLLFASIARSQGELGEVVTRLIKSIGEINNTCRYPVKRGGLQEWP